MRFMLLSLTFAVFALPTVAGAAPAKNQAGKKTTTKRRATRKTPRKAKRARSSAGQQAGQAAANALANFCPQNIECRVGDTRNVKLKRVFGPSQASNGKMVCRYELPGFRAVDSRADRCANTPIPFRDCKGVPAHLRVSRAWVKSRTSTPTQGKCTVAPKVTLQQK